MMSEQLETLKQQRISKARVALQRSRDLRNSRRTLGVDEIRQFVKDVDGDWLDEWGEIAGEDARPIRVKSQE